ncbi:MAG TPA: hypothetical protein VNV44_11740 [Solirubrobacteraceae bacterium]|jgi:hypothetical protein|nr:hypothetical protein [Solirubrobacteraceae bacterium]
MAFTLRRPGWRSCRPPETTDPTALRKPQKDPDEERAELRAYELNRQRQLGRQKRGRLDPDRPGVVLGGGRGKWAKEF